MGESKNKRENEAERECVDTLARESLDMGS